MHRALLALLTLFAVPVAFTQESIEVAALDKPSAPRILLKAKCAFADGTVVSEKLIEIEGSASTQVKREAAETACRPIMEAASATCDELANRVDVLRREWRLAAPHSYRAHELQVAIKKASASAPAYCK